MGTMPFLYGKRGTFCRCKKIKGLRGGVQRYAKPANLKIDAAMVGKNRFRMKTR